MKKRYFPLFAFFIISSSFGFAQVTSLDSTSTDSVFVNKAEEKLSLESPKEKITADDVNINKQKEMVFNVQDEYRIETPTVGLGVGLLSYQGELSRSNKALQSLAFSRIASELYLSQRLNGFLLVNCNVLFGKIAINERFGEGNRNINFESEIRAGGISLVYDFGNFKALKKQSVSPFISVGVEGFEFLSKTDLFDANGNRYHYWSDGTIRDLDENNINANNASILSRDYSYESDVRTTNERQFGKYSEFSFAFPIGGGFMFKLNNNLNFKVSYTLHKSLTNYIDGVQGSKNDNFVMTSCGLSYNFKTTQRTEFKETPMIDKKEIDFYAIENSDIDEDGVPDLQDLCQGTPLGVEVDSLGCPFDDDGDGIPNFKDKEKNSAEGAIVDNNGVTLNYSDIEAMSKFHETPFDSVYFTEGELKAEKIAMASNISTEYSVLLGTYKGGIPTDTLIKFLSIRDMKNVQLSENESMYLAGTFNTAVDAQKRLKELQKHGNPNAKIVYKENGVYHELEKLDYNFFTISDNKVVSNNSSNVAESSLDTSSTESSASLSSSDIVYRVQLGAYARALPKSIFTGIDNIEIRTEEGLYKYVSSSFVSMETASKYKVDVLLKGYEGAFITAYKDGKRVSLRSVGATLSDSTGFEDELSDTAKISTINKSLITFKVQVGLFSGKPTPERLRKLNKISNLKSETTASGLRRYVVGEFSNYSEAEKYRYKISESYGLPDAFVIAQFRGEYISVQEALSLME